MKASRFVLVFLVAVAYVAADDQDTDCERNEAAIRLEKRSCKNPCGNGKKCLSRSAECLCDGPCGKSCITKGQRCVKIHEPKNGKIVFHSGYEFKANVDYSCDTGYELIGPQNRKCRGDQSWSGDNPFCTPEGVRCQKPDVLIDHGDLDIDYDKKEYFVGDTVVYQCDIGYSQVRPAITSAECKENGEWSREIELRCQAKTCPRPQRISNGDYEGSDFSFGASILYNCFAGYILKGTAERVCNAYQEWSGRLPECEPILCSKPRETMDNGRVKLETLTFGSSILYTCDEGFLLEGSRFRTCNEDGKWDPEEPICKKADCAPPELPVKGYIDRIYENKIDNIVKSVEYKCWENATSPDFMRSDCRVYSDEALWTSPAPICFGKCPRKEDTDARYYPTDRPRPWENYDREFKHGQEMNIKCQEGSEIFNYQSEEKSLKEMRTKCEDGEWIPDVTCKPARCFCDDYTFPRSWLKENELQLKYICETAQHGDELETVCNPRFPYFKKSAKILCNRGKWAKSGNEDVKCDGYPCNLNEFSFGEGTIIKHKNQRISSETSVPHNGVISISCPKKSYDLHVNGKFEPFWTTNCNNGTIKPITAECIPGRCPCQELRDKLKGELLVLQDKNDCKERNNVEHDNSIYLKCKDEYEDKEKRTFEAVCKEKKWDIQDNKCEKLCQCINFARDVEDAAQSMTIKEVCGRNYSKGDEIELKCHRGYSSDGGNLKTKCINGYWKITGDFCYKQCRCDTFHSDTGNSLMKIIDEDKCMKSIDNGKTVSITCLNNLELKGTGTVTCKEGRWEAPKDTTCSAPCSCDDFEKEQRFTTFELLEPCKGSVSSKSTRAIGCKKDYSPLEKMQTVECKDGEWTISADITCKAKCKYENGSFNNGFLMKPRRNEKLDLNSETNHKGRARLTCLDGYELADRSKAPIFIECNDGKWENVKKCIGNQCFCGSFKSDVGIVSQSVQLKGSCKEKIASGRVFYLSCSEQETEELGEAKCELGKWFITKNASCYAVDHEVKPEKSTTTHEEEIEQTSLSSMSTSSIHTKTSSLATNGTNEEVCDPFTGCLEGVTPSFGLDESSSKKPHSSNCQLDLNPHVRAVSNGQVYTPDRPASSLIQDKSIIKFRCTDIQKFLFIGKNIVQCIKGKWNETLPSCIPLKKREALGSPLIEYETAGQFVVNDDGVLNVTEGQPLLLRCFYNRNVGEAKWTSENPSTMPSAEWNFREDEYILRFPQLQNNHQSKYTCCVMNNQCNSISIAVQSLMCEIPTLQNNMFVRSPRGVQSVPLYSEIEIGCDRYYYIEGEARIKCILKNDNLGWSHSTPKCLEKLCTPYLAPENGSVRKTTGRAINSEVTFQCKGGYKLQGAEKVTCIEKGQSGNLEWSAPFPKCEKTTGKACEERTFTYGRVEYDTRVTSWFGARNYRHGTTMTVTCKDGYEIEADEEVEADTIKQKAQSVCEDGSWKPFLFCIAARCSCDDFRASLNVMNRVFKDCHGIKKRGNYASIICQEGFTSRTSDITIQCHNGNWYFNNRPENECKKVESTSDCRLEFLAQDNLRAIYRDTKYEGNEVYTFKTGSAVKFQCLDAINRVLKGVNKVVCVNGEWTANKPECLHTSSTNVGPPYVRIYKSNVKEQLADDGRLVFPKYGPFTIECISPTYHELEIGDKSFTKNLYYLRQYFSIYDYTPPSSKSEIYIKCSYVFGHLTYSTEYNVVFADTCLINALELNHRGLRVVPDALQTLYVEGDKIEVECTSGTPRTNQHFMVCSSNYKWEFYTNIIC